jgi:hypothetical protein
MPEMPVAHQKERVLGFNGRKQERTQRSESAHEVHKGPIRDLALFAFVTFVFALVFWSERATFQNFGI